MNPNANGWNLYGGRGITICDRWSSFASFLTDMGERPAGTTLDRRDSDGNYEPNNCRWATAAEQSRNTRRSKLTESIVRSIVVGKHRDTPSRSVALEFGVSKGHVDNLRCGLIWKDVVQACRDEQAEIANSRGAK